jgi:hypothetical protein
VRTISIAEVSFFDAFGIDADFHDLYPQAVYLDIEAGDVIWIFEEDQDAEMVAGIDPRENQKLREKIESSTEEKYFEIPGRSHAEHHEILQEFLKSNWTSDGKLRKRVYDAYSGSIGRWIEAVDDRTVVHTYYDFRDSKIKEIAEEFLQEHGIKPLWR